MCCLFFFFSFQLLPGSTLMLLRVNFCSVLAEFILGERVQPSLSSLHVKKHSGCDDGLHV